MLKIKVERKRRPILLVLGSAAILAIAGAIFLAGISPLVAYTKHQNPRQISKQTDLWLLFHNCNHF